MRFVLGALLLLSASACSKKKPPPVQVIPVPMVAAAAPPAASDAAPAEAEPPARIVASKAKLHLTLRSTPPGASVSVDGKLVGTTPVRFTMDDDGRDHEFDFVQRGHLPWKLSFSPSRDGVIHATMVEAMGRDAG